MCAKMWKAGKVSLSLPHPWPLSSAESSTKLQLQEEEKLGKQKRSRHGIDRERQEGATGNLGRRILEDNRKRLKVVKPGSKTSFPTTDIEGTYAPPFHRSHFLDMFGHKGALRPRTKKRRRE